jgi:putative ABC transport system permease protein
MASLARTDSGLQKNTWDDFSFYSYVQLDKVFDPSVANLLGLEKQIDLIFHKHNPEMPAAFQLQPLTKIHLAPERLRDLQGHGNAQYVNIFFILSFYIYRNIHFYKSSFLYLYICR